MRVAEARAAWDGLGGPCELIGIELRSFLVLHMRQAGGSVRVAELVAAMEAGGFAVAGRPSKVISDSLRWEVARGRVRRLRRGVYAFTGRAPRTTLKRMKDRLAAAAARSPEQVRSQPLRKPRPLVSPDGPWRYRLRYALAPPRRPYRPPRPDLAERRRAARGVEVGLGWAAWGTVGIGE